VITLGSRGCFVSHGDDRRGDNDAYYRLAAEKVQAIDTTGAGDAFSAGLILQMAQGIDLAASLKFASRLGALACETPGPRADLMRIRELTEQHH
jgi:ribokinase